MWYLGRWCSQIAAHGTQNPQAQLADGRRVVDQEWVQVNLARIAVADSNPEHRARALELKLCESATADIEAAVRDAEM